LQQRDESGGRSGHLSINPGSLWDYLKETHVSNNPILGEAM